MLYVYYGDVFSARARVRATIKSLLKKNPEALSLRIMQENFAEFSLAELVTAQALFKNEYIVLLDNLLQEAEAKDVVLELVKEIAESPNVFFLLEEKLDVKTLKKLDKYAKHVKHVGEVAPHTAVGGGTSLRKERFNTFSLADAFGERDKKKLWVLFWRAKYAGVSDEEIQGVLFWMAKAMLLARRSGGATSAGLKPFVYNKALRFASKRSEKELQNNLNTLVVLPHKSRRNSVPLATSLEQFILR